MTDDLFDEDEAAKILRQKPRTLTVWRSTGKGPRFLKLGRRVFYRKEWLTDFLATCEVDPSAR
ncbi:helix-turn-helix protein [Rhizobium sp. PP-WC-2G-219]|uniref:Helix-turn-helix domain-containing protein n=1 Tax=Ferranicluibacter rubi TaxID=2715133 RepID=A0AA43ZGM3_9HYPH|nr:helix-turn-helix domain-containing protein [Ferranicluibacter rubi]NHT77530.1 helix-turn-helix domain-containing protein [Ferranicluibacter rubi]TCL89833.1 helix-turn-helix protein [Rhizobium sp. PP-WC-2G-219]